MEKELNLAIFSPFETNTETFIKAHRQLPFRISYYSNGLVPGYLDGEGSLIQKQYLKKIVHKVFDKRFSFAESVLMSSLRKRKIDCILAEYGPTAASSLELIKHLKIPLIVHFHGYDISKRDTVELYGRIYQQVFQYANRIIAVSRRMVKDLVVLGCPQNKIVLDPYGPDESYFNVRSDFRNQRFISIGRFVDKKAPYYTIAAFAKVISDYPEAELWMVGDGPLLNACKNIARYFGIDNRVIFNGVLSQKDIQNALGKSIAFVQHSLVADNGDSEGAPVAIMEAQAAGLPVISTLHAGIPDIVIHGKTGLLVPEHDVSGMAESMKTILQNPEEARDLGEKGKERIREHFSLSRHLEILSKIITESVDE